MNSKANSRKIAPVLNYSNFKHYIDMLNENDNELYCNHIPNINAWEFLQENIPLFECPDKQLELTYYFRWWVFRKHIKNTPEGFVITEFLPPVPWAGKNNTIVMAAPMHLLEGRWLHNHTYLDDYSRFWYKKGGSLHDYTNCLPYAMLSRAYVTGDMNLLGDLLSYMVDDYDYWERGFMKDNVMIGKRQCGLFFTTDGRDGGELSAGGHGYRPLINSAMYGTADAIAKIAEIMGMQNTKESFSFKASILKELVQNRLWNEEKEFFTILYEDENTLSDARELYGLSPWMFNMPDRGYETGWKEVINPEGFYSPYGLTFCEQRHPKFQLSYEGHECKWNGPVWPLSTSITLTAMVNLLNNYDQNVVNKRNFYDLLVNYSNSQRMILEDGRIIPWIDENINPYTGDWISRTILRQNANANKIFNERGKDYNHSSFNDLIISGLVGIRPSFSNELRINPLIPENVWDWFCLDHVYYHGKVITVLWDRDNNRYGLGKGLRIFVNGEERGCSEKLEEIVIEI